MTIRAIIVDFGSVLVGLADETPRQRLAARYDIRLDRLYKVVFESDSARRGTLGEITIEQHWQNIATYLRLPTAELPGFIQQFWSADGVNEELVALLQKLHPRYKLGLLSNAWSDLRAVLRDRWRLDGLFDELIISAEVGLVKPDPRIYRLALERLGVQPDEAVFVDDVLENVSGALAAGLSAIHYQTFEQMSGELEKLIGLQK